VARAEDLLGILARGEGDLIAARAHLERSRQAAADGADPGPRIAALNSLALVHADLGNRDQAIELTTEALALCERQGDRHRQAALENNLADLLQAEGRGDEAMVHLKRAVAIFAEVGGQAEELQPEIWKLIEW
jgi:tetratricopeptide (TPR) repeat protein